MKKLSNTDAVLKSFTTSETKRDYNWYIWVTSGIAELLKDLSKLGKVVVINRPT